MNYYDHKLDDYYSKIRRDLLPHIPNLPQARLLDVGCGAGNTLCYLKESGRIGEAVGVDFTAIPNSNQQNPLIDRFIVADIQRQDLKLEHNHFDILLCADVLEHLTDPWSSLHYLRQFLKADGRLVVSVPNIREFRALKKIFLKGDFAYAPSGILDKTHLRFFCKKNIEALVRDAGFIIDSTAPGFATCPLQKRRKLFSKLSLGIFDQFLAQQYIVVARKPR
jgi:2-polyprenyl-3-methyl-5-hydroxy-6-metoxy-1,4-benzoquinol methylase